MASRLDEVDAGMHTVIHDVHAIDLVFGIEVCVESLFNVLHDRTPRIFVIDEVSETRSVDHGES